jgi:hypothetical protein
MTVHSGTVEYQFNVYTGTAGMVVDRVR